jgi:hypothetical protein
MNRIFDPASSRDKPIQTRWDRGNTHWMTEDLWADSLTTSRLLQRKTTVVGVCVCVNRSFPLWATRDESKTSSTCGAGKVGPNLTLNDLDLDNHPSSQPRIFNLERGLSILVFDSIQRSAIDHRKQAASNRGF